MGAPEGADTGHISIHALLAESDGKGSRRCVLSGISIHALLAESDKPTTGRNNKHDVFLSTLSLRRATNCCPYLSSFTRISIHALLAESDRHYGLLRPSRVGYFYPRSPCGERPSAGRLQIIYRGFLSTLSLRRATYLASQTFDIDKISIHALLAESDSFIQPKDTPQ